MSQEEEWLTGAAVDEKEGTAVVVGGRVVAAFLVGVVAVALLATEFPFIRCCFNAAAYCLLPLGVPMTRVTPGYAFEEDEEAEAEVEVELEECECEGCKREGGT